MQDIHLGELFRIFRENRGITLQEVARVGISTSQLSRFERGESELTIKRFLAILEVIHVSLDEFIYTAQGFQLTPTQE